MAARESCASLISHLRRLLRDPAGAEQVWSDDELQEFLDGRREEARYLRLCELESRAPGGAISYLVYTAPRGDWDEAVVLYDQDYDPLTPSASDYQAGRWEFESEPDRPVYLVGYAYDLYGAAGDVCEAWASSHKLETYFASAGQQFSRQQKHQMLLQQAATYHAQARPRVAQMVRGDVR